MAGQRGRDIEIKVGDGGDPQTFMSVAGIRARTISLGAGAVECTTAESPSAWRRLLARAGTKRVEVAGSGAFKDAASDARLRAIFFAREAATFELVIPDFGKLRGPFAITELTYGGAHDGEATFSVRLASAGVIEFSAI